jgi:hypothetical protein
MNKKLIIGYIKREVLMPRNENWIEGNSKGFGKR